MSLAQNPRQYVIRFLYIGVALVILLRLFFLQIFEDKYKIMANDIAIYRKVVYPPRGIIYDRNGKVMLYNQVVYDLMVTTSNVPETLIQPSFARCWILTGRLLISCSRRSISRAVRCGRAFSWKS